MENRSENFWGMEDFGTVEYKGEDLILTDKPRLYVHKTGLFVGFRSHAVYYGREYEILWETLDKGLQNYFCVTDITE